MQKANLTKEEEKKWEELKDEHWWQSQGTTFKERKFEDKSTKQVHTLYERIDPPEFYDISKLTYEELLEGSKKESEFDIQPKTQVYNQLSGTYGSSEKCSNLSIYKIVDATACFLDDALELHFNHNTLWNIFVMLYIPFLFKATEKFTSIMKKLTMQPFSELFSYIWGIAGLTWVCKSMTKAGRDEIKLTLKALLLPGIYIHRWDSFK